MSEGDTVHRLAIRLKNTVAGQLVTEVSVPAPRSDLRRQLDRVEMLTGSEIVDIRALGKHLLFEFSCCLILHSHLGMNGSWRYGQSFAALGRSTEGAWALISTQAAVLAQFGGRLLKLSTEAELRRDSRIRRLGPDVLAADFDPESTARRIVSGSAERELGDALLDQSLVAGIGNVLKSESCFVERADPFMSVGSFGEARLSALLRTTRALMLESVRSGSRRRQVYRGSGKPCPVCGETIRSAGQGESNRTTYWCSACVSATTSAGAAGHGSWPPRPRASRLDSPR